MAESLSSLNPNNNLLPDATAALMFDFLERNEDIVEQRKALNKRKKDLLVEVEKAGIPRASWEHFLKTREEAGVVRERVDAVWRQLHAWDLKPVGLQFEGDLTQTIAGEPNVAELKRVDGLGFDAGKSGTKREANPFTPGTEIYARWDTSWLRGSSEVPNGEAAPAGRRKGGGRRPAGTTVQ